ncbi:hypothetical protein L0B52_04005 [Suttonella sp. R2A3]|uniref:hypothetical protein n=1 Tax=Suttonella sp. R2A3 TaxID=2908648 RepID=UPI001F221C1E|nr:hypothetical protein [Suttonella sp. R2A3]UJF25318.1 hypothetical protein L0B52_04005 [Suttonella sp. R2A3]
MMRNNLFFYILFVSFSRVFIILTKPFIRKKDILLISQCLDSSILFNMNLAKELNGVSKIIIKNRLNLLAYTLLGKPEFIFQKSKIKPMLRSAYGRGLGMHKSKLIIHMENAWGLSAAIKKYSGAKLINIPHCVIGTGSNYSIIDFDYYFIYGDSSIDNLNRGVGIHIHSGSTKLVKIGPLMCEIDDGLKLSSEHVAKISNSNFERVVIYSSAFTKNTAVQKLLELTHEMVVDFAKKDPNTLIIVTLHPCETVNVFWHKYKKLINLIVLPSGHNKDELASYASVHLTMLSNSVIDYGLRGLDSIIIRYSDYGEDFLQFSKFFKVCSSAEELMLAVKSHAPEQSRLNDFLPYHCEYTDMDTFSRMVDYLNRILAGEELKGIPFHVS